MNPRDVLALVPWRLLGVAVLIGGLCLWSRSCGVDAGRAQGRAEVAKIERAKAEQEVKLAHETAQAAKAAADRYIQRAEAQAAAASQYQKALNDANRRADATVADLLAGNLRLRKLWQGCQAVSAAGSAAAAGFGVDGGTDDRDASAGRIVRAAAKCDAQVRGLQAVVRGERAVVTP